MAQTIHAQPYQRMGIAFLYWSQSNSLSRRAANDSVTPIYQSQYVSLVCNHTSQAIYVLIRIDFLMTRATVEQILHTRYFRFLHRLHRIAQ